MKPIKTTLVILLAVINAACTLAPDGAVEASLTGDADNSGEAGIIITTNNLAGQVQALQVKDMEVEAYYFDETDQKVLIGKTIADEDGYYSIPFELNDTIVFLEAYNGSYKESSSQEWVYLSKAYSLKSIAHVQGDSDVKANINLYTTLMQGKYEHLISLGRDQKQSLDFSIAEVSSYLQLNPLTSEVLYPVVDESINYDIEHGPLALGTLTTITSDLIGQYNLQLGFPEHSVFTIAKFSKIMYDDVRFDGFLDGVGYRGNGEESGELFFGVGAVTADTYRTDIARQTIEFIFSDRNKSGLNFMGYREEAARIASYKGSLFKELAAEAIDPQPPEVEWNVTQNEVLHGDKNFIISMSDNVGIDYAELKIADFLIDRQENIKDIDLDFIWDSAEYQDGIVDLELTVVDLLGNKTVLTKQVFNQNVHYFPDVVPVLTRYTASYTNQTSINFRGNYEDFGAGIEFISVNGTEVQLDENNDFEYPLSLSAGENTITVYARTQFQREKTQQFTIISDQQPAILTWETGTNGYQTYFEIGTTNSMVVLDELHVVDTTNLISVPATHLSLNGLPVLYADLAAENRAFYSFNVSDTDGVNDRSDEVVVTFNYKIAGKDHHQGTLPITTNGRYIIPLSEEVLGQNFYYNAPQDIHVISITVTDAAGNQSSDVVKFRMVSGLGDISIDAPVVATNSEILTTPFEFRSELHDKFSKAVKYTVHNSSDTDVWVKPQKTGITYNMNRKVSTHIKEHKVNRTISTHFYAADPTDTTKTIEIGSFFGLNGGSDLVETSGGAGLWAGAANDKQECIDKLKLDGFTLFENSTSGITTEDFILTDTLATSQDSGYEPIPGFGGSPSSVLEHSTSANKGYSLGIMQVDNMSVEKIFIPTYGAYCSVPTQEFSYDSRKIYNNDIVIQGVSPYGIAQKRITSEVSAPGWPKMNETLTDYLTSGLLSIWRAYDSLDQELGANNGWFKIRAGESINVYLEIYTPDLAIDDEPYVAEYYEQTSDVQYLYNVDSESMFRFSVDTGDNNVDIMPEVVFPVDSGVHQLEANR